MLGLFAAGAGIALPYASSPRIGLAALPPTQAGKGSGVLDACSFLGGTVGVTCGGIVFGAAGFAGVLCSWPSPRWSAPRSLCDCAPTYCRPRPPLREPDRISSREDCLSESFFLSAAELAERYGKRTLSPVELLDATLARAEIVQQRLNPFRVIDAERALQAARASERRWGGKPLSPLDGVPVAIKDNQAMAGEPPPRAVAPWCTCRRRRRTPRMWRGCAKPVRCSTPAPRCRISPGKR